MLSLFHLKALNHTGCPEIARHKGAYEIHSGFRLLASCFMKWLIWASNEVLQHKRGRFRVDYMRARRRDLTWL